MDSRGPLPFFLKNLFIKYKKDFTNGKLKGWLSFMLLLLLGVSVISYFLYGPYYSPDTINYFHFSRKIFLLPPWTSVYSPFYPFLLFCFSSFPFFSLFQAAHLLILIQYVVGFYFLVHLSKSIAGFYSPSSKNNLRLTLLMLITYHTWWSFRIISWAHADATFYTLLIIWSYYLTRSILKESFLSLLIFSLLSAILVWVKLNALALIPFFLALVLSGKPKKKWLIPLLTTSLSYGLYQMIFPKNILESNLQESLYSSYFSFRSLEIFYYNMAEVSKVSMGFIFSDTVAAFIPYFIAFLGGLCLLFFLVGRVIMEIRKGFTLSSYFLLFGLVYLLSFLVFQQITFFQEINYRTIFPFFISFSWYLWTKLLTLKKNSSIVILTVAFLMTSHTVIGHLWLWKRQDVNSLFEVDRLRQSEMEEKIRLLQNQLPFQNLHLLSDYPEKLSLLLNDPSITHYDPAFQFINGKRRPAHPPERQKNLHLLKQKLLKGEVILVLFGKDESLVDFARNKGLCLFEYPQGLIISGPQNPGAL